MKKHLKHVTKTIAKDAAIPLKSIPMSQKDVHTEHCCVLHGCKYGKDFFCTVVQKKKPQSFICESCAHQGIINLDSLRAVLQGKKPRCPHCDHVLP
jgi:hypothetical protein